MTLPVLKLRMLPEGFCMRCGAHGYVDDKTCLCGGCLGISLAVYHKRKSMNLAEQLKRNFDEFGRLWRKKLV